MRQPSIHPAWNAITQVAAGASEIRLGAVHPTRDFTFVADTARAFEALAECDSVILEPVEKLTIYTPSAGTPKIFFAS